MRVHYSASCVHLTKAQMNSCRSQQQPYLLVALYFTFCTYSFSPGLHVIHPVYNVSLSACFLCTVAKEERRRLCKCLLYESLLKMGLKNDKYKTSGHRPNICCLEGGGWSEQGHQRNTEGKWPEEQRKTKQKERLRNVGRLN